MWAARGWQPFTFRAVIDQGSQGVRSVGRAPASAQAVSQSCSQWSRSMSLRCQGGEDASYRMAVRRAPIQLALPKQLAAMTGARRLRSQALLSIGTSGSPTNRSSP